MSRTQLSRYLGTAGLALALAAPALLAEPPAWLMRVAAQPLPAFASEVPAAVLLDESETTVQPDGRETVLHRYAVRILNRSGRETACGEVGYLEKEDSVTSCAAWLIRTGKEVRPKEKPLWVDRSAAGGGEVTSEYRCRGVDYSDLTVDGDVFGYETTVEGRLLFAQESASWGGRLPVLLDRYTLRLPPAWTIRPVVDGPQSAKLQASTGTACWTWEMHDQPYRPDEPAMTGMARMDVRLFLDLVPPAGQGGKVRGFQSWADVTAWLLELQSPQCDTNPALAATVRELTAGCADPVGRMRALSRYAQSLRYVSADKGINEGFGYRPRKATEVHAKGWGDCKAKANLLRAMLREIGIESYMVQADTRRGREILDAWPSPMQFNHAILAIRAGDSVDLPACVTVPKLGRLLFFDATDNDVLLGDLPLYLQGSKVHVVAPGSDALTPLPVLPTATHHLAMQRVELTLDVSGAVVGECSFGGPGSVGADLRMRIRQNSAKDFRKKINELIAATVRGVTLDDLSTDDDPLTGECRVKCRFSSPRFAQLMPGGLAVVRLDVLSRDGVPAFPAKERKLPIGIPPILVRDEVTLKLPPGYVIEEMPAKTELSSIYGRYESSYEKTEGSVIARRSLQLEDRIVPVAEYAALKKFLGDVAKADRSSVVVRQTAQAVAAPAAPAK